MTDLEITLEATQDILEVNHYQPSRPTPSSYELKAPSIIKLASNENLLGPSTKVVLALQEILPNVHYYPDTSVHDFKGKLASFLSVPTNQLTIGNGSENILEMIIKSYLKPSDEAIISEHAFITIPSLIANYAGTIVRIADNHYRHDISRMIDAVTKHTKLVFVVNPNNPIGTYITHDELVTLLENISPKILVVVDEAYYEYVNHKDYPATITLLKNYSNLVITRTFSKAYGLAGLRLGYAISSAPIAEVLNRARLTFNVNALAIAAGKAALEDQEHINKTLMMTANGRAQIIDALQDKVAFFPSVTNFLTMSTRCLAQDICAQLLERGIAVRPLHDYQLPTCIRVTVGSFEQNEKFISALHSILS